jgi:hypothetical protein
LNAQHTLQSLSAIDPEAEEINIAHPSRSSTTASLTPGLDVHLFIYHLRFHAEDAISKHPLVPEAEGDAEFARDNRCVAQQLVLRASMRTSVLDGPFAVLMLTLTSLL